MLGEDLPGEGYAQIGLMRNDTEPSCHCERYFWEYNVDGQPFNAVGAVWRTPNLTYAQSSYKGTSGNRTSFYFLQMRQAGGAWVDTDIQTNLSLWAHYNHLTTKGFTNVESDTSLEIWN